MAPVSHSDDWGWDVKRRIPIEKPKREKPEARAFHRHHRPVLDAGDVRYAKRVPQNDIGILDRRIAG